MPYEIVISKLPSGARYVRAEAVGDITSADIDSLYSHPGLVAGLPLLTLTHRVRTYHPEARARIAKWTGQSDHWNAVVISDPQILATSHLMKRVSHATKHVALGTEAEGIQWLEDRLREDPVARAKAMAP